jgi:hypothetical protein
MPRKPFNRSMVATLLGLLIAVPAAVLTLATPASADGSPCCQVSINNMPGQFAAGGGPQPFTLRVVNQSDVLRDINVTFFFHANGLNASQVHLQRQRIAGGTRSIGARNHDGVITATDQIDMSILAPRPGQAMNMQYQLFFGQKTPSSGLSVRVVVQPRHSKSGPANAGPYQSMIVAAGTVTQPTTTATETATPSDTPSTDATDSGVTNDQPTLGSGDSNGGDSGGGSMMWLAYTFGALLLLGGVGVIGTLLWRRSAHAVETDWDEQQPNVYGQPEYAQQAYPAQSGYAPNQVAPTQATPTQMFPTQMAPTQMAPTQAANYSSPTQAMPTRATPTAYGVPGRHTAPSSQYPVPQDPYADVDQTWVDPSEGR